MTNIKQTLRERFWSKFNIAYVAPKGFAELGTEIVDFCEAELRNHLDTSIKDIGGMKVLHQEFENNTGKLHCDPVTEICEITAYNSALADIITRLEAQRELLK